LKKDKPPDAEKMHQRAFRLFFRFYNINRKVFAHLFHHKTRSKTSVFDRAKRVAF